MSWQQLITIGKEAQDMRRDDRQKPIVECPICGEALTQRAGLYNCPFGHFTQRGSQRGPESY